MTKQLHAADERASRALADAEHKLSLANTEITQWKSKFDAEVMLHHEEVEDLRKKMLQKQAEIGRNMLAAGKQEF